MKQGQKNEIEKDFCFFNEKLDIFSGKIKQEEPLNDNLKEQALDLIKKQKNIEVSTSSDVYV